MGKVRLDLLLTERGLVESREQARRLIMAGEVMVDGQVQTKPGRQVSPASDISVRSSLPYVSRGGLKLEGALEDFGIDVTGQVAADIGASTGGFTDCLLQRGAAKVYAIDVGYGQLAWKLRQDPRVVVMERTNIRHLRGLPEPVDLATVDVSFISLRLVLPVVRTLLKPEGRVIALIKPQFEAGPKQVGKGGVVRDPAVHRAVLEQLLAWSLAEGFRVHGLTPSRLKGPAGNVEFFVHLGRAERGQGSASDVKGLVERCLDAVPHLVC